MADSIKIGSLDISAFKVGSGDCNIYLGDILLYSGGTTPPTPPTPSYKWLATYSNENVTSAECDSSSAITQNEIELTDLVSVKIGDCVTSIGDSAFEYCDSLTSCTIGSGVTSIEDFAFADCSGLISITVNAVTPPTLGAWAFDNTNDCPIYVPSGSVSTYQSDSDWSDYADRIQAIQNS